ncbi:MAG: hypothetical protein Q9176_006155 [Flavoplaca citrina]
MDDLISQFMEKTSIDEIYAEHIRKGAYLAQDRSAFDDLRDDALTLRPEERSALSMEDPKTGSKWNQPWILYALVGCCSLGAAVQGWDETAVNGAQLYYRHAFGIGDDDSDRQAGLVGLTAFGIFLGYVAGVAFRSVLDGDSNVCPRDGSEATLLRINCAKSVVNEPRILKVVQYSSPVFEDAGLEGQEPLLASMGFGLINFLFAIPAFYTIDTFGRRNLLLFTFPFMALFQLLTGLGFLLEGRGQLAMVMTGMYLFSVAYSPGEGPVPFLYSAESMPLYVRDVGMSMATALTWFFNFLLAVTFPSFQNAFGNTGAFGYYAAWCMVGWVLILLFVPETKDLTLEQLDARFSVSSRAYAKYAMRQCSYFVRHYVLRRSNVKRPTIQFPQEFEYGQQSSDQPRKISFEKDERILTSSSP